MKREWIRKWMPRMTMKLGSRSSLWDREWEKRKKGKIFRESNMREKEDILRKTDKEGKDLVLWEWND